MYIESTSKRQATPSCGGTRGVTSTDISFEAPSAVKTCTPAAADGRRFGDVGDDQGIGPAGKCSRNPADLNAAALRWHAETQATDAEATAALERVRRKRGDDWLRCGRSSRDERKEKSR